MQIRKLIKDYGIVAVTTANQPQPQVQAPCFGDLDYLDVEVSAVVTIGTGTIRATSTPLIAIHNFVWRDRAQQAVLNAPEGTDIPYEAYLLSKKLGAPSTRGKFSPTTAMTSAGGVWNWEIPMRHTQYDQPAVLDVTLGTIGDLCSTVGTATATLQLKVFGVWIDPAVTPEGLPIFPTLRVDAVPKIAITGAGDNPIDMSTNIGRLIDDLAVLVGAADADATSINFQPAGGVGFDTIPVQQFADQENIDLESGHQTAFWSFGCTPFFVTIQTKLIVNCAITKAIRLYIMRESV